MLNRNFGRASYAVALTLFFVPLVDASMSVLPLRIGDSRWRFGTIGLLSNALMIPMIGVLIGFATALAFEHRGRLRAFGILAWVGFGVCLLALAAFGLDTLQSQGQINPKMRLSFVVASGTAALKIIIGAVTFALFAMAGKGLKAAVPKPAKRVSVLIPETRGTKEVATS